MLFRALRTLSFGHVVEVTPREIFFVQSSIDDSKVYRVVVVRSGELTCTCIHSPSKDVCSHRLGVMIREANLLVEFFANFFPVTDLSPPPARLDAVIWSGQSNKRGRKKSTKLRPLRTASPTRQPITIPSDESEVSDESSLVSHPSDDDCGMIDSAYNQPSVTTNAANDAAYAHSLDEVVSMPSSSAMDDDDDNAINNSDVSKPASHGSLCRQFSTVAAEAEENVDRRRPKRNPKKRRAPDYE
jgi:hypothetical protein